MSAGTRLSGVLLLLLVVGRVSTAGVPQRVMSINLCSDQLLLDLLPPSRITSVTSLSRERYESHLSAEAWKVGVNYGTAEEVVRQRPDLVLAGSFTTPATRQLVKDVGIPILEVPPANTFQEIRDETREVGHAVGADQQAERLIRQMDSALAQLAATAPRRPIRIVGWDGGGSAIGKDRLFNAIVQAAGGVNIGASAGLQRGRFGVEQVLMARPDLLAYGDATISTPALRGSALEHPAVRALYRGRVMVYPELLESCGLPQTVEAAQQMRQMMLHILSSAPGK